MPGKIREDHSRFTIFFMAILALESLAVAVYLANLPGDPKNSVLLGFSAQRLALMAGMIAAAGLFGFLALGKKTIWVEKLAGGRVYLTATVILSTLFLVGFCITQLPRSLIDPALLAYYERLYPLLLWLWIVSLEAVLYLTWLRFGWSLKPDGSRKRILQISLIAAGVFLIVAIFILVTRFGLNADSEGWRKMGSPLLAWQIGLAVASGLILLLLDRHIASLSNRWARFSLDTGLMLALYVLALALWLPQPLQNSYFSPEPRLPNQEVYPYSDALYYGLASESVTIGTGLYGGEVTPRPFYLTVLSYLTAAAQGDYGRIITLQTFLLALVPVFLYLVGKQLMGRPLGFAIGLLGVFRELNAILSTHYIELSHSKLIMADMPTLLAILVLTWLMILWWKGNQTNPLWAMGVGGALGWVMLFRTQAVLLLPFILILILVQTPRKWKTWLARMGLFCAGLLLMIAPWLIRNYALTGQIVFDDPTTQTQFLQGRLGMDESAVEEDKSFIEIALQNPGAILSFTANHFMRNEIGTLFVTPPQRFVETVDTVMTEYPFWRDDRIDLTFGQGVLLIVTLGLMAIGIGSLYSRLGWVGLIPLAVNGIYTLSNALARNSSGRYNLPADWVGYVYLAAGLLQVGGWILLGLNRLSPETQITSPSPVEATPDKISMRKWVTLVITLILVGSLIPITEMVFPKRYEALTRADIPTLLKDWGVDPAAAKTLLAEPDVTFIYGRELYPRYYRPGDGEMGSNWVAYAPLDFCRMGFVITGPAGIDQAVVMLDRPPRSFPNRSDTLVLGRISSAEVRGKPVEYLQADLIILRGNPPVVVEGLREAPARCRLQ